MIRANDDGLVWSAEPPLSDADLTATVEQIRSNLRRHYQWVDSDDLAGYAALGAMQAAGSFDPSRGMTLLHYVAVRGRLLAIDRMRADGVLHRRSVRHPVILHLRENTDGAREDLEDRRMGDLTARLAVRDQVDHLLRRLPQRDRQLAVLYYGFGLTFKEIACIQGASESSISLRHRALLRRLRRLAPDHTAS